MLVQAIGLPTFCVLTTIRFYSFNEQKAEARGIPFALKMTKVTLS